MKWIIQPTKLLVRLSFWRSIWPSLTWRVLWPGSYLPIFSNEWNCHVSVKTSSSDSDDENHQTTGFSMFSNCFNIGNHQKSQEKTPRNHGVSLPRSLPGTPRAAPWDLGTSSDNFAVEPWTISKLLCIYIYIYITCIYIYIYILYSIYIYNYIILYICVDTYNIFIYLYA